MPILKKNLHNLKSVKNYEIIEKDIYRNEIFSEFGFKFDIIFLDPPYKDKDLKNLFIKIKKNEILKNNGIIILHRHKKESDYIPLNFKLIEEKIYGISKIAFLSNLN